MLAEGLSAATWAAIATAFAMSIMVAVRALIRTPLLQLADGSRDVHRFFWQVFAVGPRLTLLAAGIVLRAMGDARSQPNTLWLLVVLGVLILAYVTAELLEGAFYHPDKGFLYRTEGILGVLTPLFIGSSASTVALACLVLTHTLGA